MIKLPLVDSKNKKLGYNVRATYRKVGETCPSSCSHLKTRACYAMYHFVGIHSNRSEYDISDGERLYEWIMRMPPHRYVRHHVSGDVMKPDNTVDKEYLGHMVKAHSKRKDIRGWGYTHAWREINPLELNSDRLCFNASCDTDQDVVDAINSGWPATVVLSEPRKKINGYGVVICPNQTNGITCSQCKLCFNHNRKSVVGFLAHGAGKNKIR